MTFYIVFGKNNILAVFKDSYDDTEMIIPHADEWKYIAVDDIENKFALENVDFKFDQDLLTYDPVRFITYDNELIGELFLRFLAHSGVKELYNEEAGLHIEVEDVAHWIVYDSEKCRRFKLDDFQKLLSNICYLNIVAKNTDYKYILYHKCTEKVDKFLTKEDLNNHIKYAGLNPSTVKVFKAE